jgi:hypothetical protein
MLQTCDGTLSVENFVFLSPLNEIRTLLRPKKSRHNLS